MTEVARGIHEHVSTDETAPSMRSEWTILNFLYEFLK